MFSHVVSNLLEFFSIYLSHYSLNEISDNPDQPTVEHFQMLRRQWASKAQLLMATLDELPDADTAAVQGKWHHECPLFLHRAARVENVR